MTQSEIKALLPRWILNSSTYSVSITDLEGKYIFVNNVFYERFSFICENFIGLDFNITMHPEDWEKAIQASLECIQNPDKHVKIYIRKPNNDHESFYWTHWEFSLFKDLDHNPIGILCIGHDVTVEKMVQKQLKESQSKLSAILDSTIHSNVCLNPEMKVIYYNRVAQESLKKYFGKEIKVDDSYLDFVLPQHQDLFFKDFKTALNGEVVQVEWEAFFESGIYLRTTFFPVYNENHNIFGVAFNSEDITAKKKDEFKIKEQNKRLLEIAWSQSHQIRGPLSSIMSIVTLVNEQIDLESKLEAMSYLDEATKKLDQVIRDIVEKTDLESEL
jgi:PAS domain S-box-containing protein